MAGAPGGWESVIRRKLQERRKRHQLWRRIKEKAFKVLSCPLKEANNLLNTLRKTEL